MLGDALWHRVDGALALLGDLLTLLLGRPADLVAHLRYETAGNRTHVAGCSWVGTTAADNEGSPRTLLDREVREWGLNLEPWVKTIIVFESYATLRSAWNSGQVPPGYPLLSPGGNPTTLFMDQLCDLLTRRGDLAVAFVAEFDLSSYRMIMSMADRLPAGTRLHLLAMPSDKAARIGRAMTTEEIGDARSWAAKATAKSTDSRFHAQHRNFYKAMGKQGAAFAEGARTASGGQWWFHGCGEDVLGAQIEGLSPAAGEKSMDAQLEAARNVGFLLDAQLEALQKEQRVLIAHLAAAEGRKWGRLRAAAAQ